jgi:hypothetical protein
MANQSTLRGAASIKQLKRAKSNMSQSSAGSATPNRQGTEEIGDGSGPAPKKKKKASHRVTIEEVPDEDAYPQRTSSDEETTDKDVEQDETAEEELALWEV